MFVIYVIRNIKCTVDYLANPGNELKCIMLSQFLWTPAVVRQCTFMCFFGERAEGKG